MEHTEFLARLDPKYTPVKTELELSRAMLYSLAEKFVEWFREDVYNLDKPSHEHPTDYKFKFCAGVRFMQENADRYRNYLNRNSRYFAINSDSTMCEFVSVRYVSHYYNVDVFTDYLEVSVIDESHDECDVKIPVPINYFREKMDYGTALDHYRLWYIENVGKWIKDIYKQHWGEAERLKALKLSAEIKKLEEQAEKLGFQIVAKSEESVNENKTS